jgi:hypothetical protein
MNNVYFALKNLISIKKNYFGKLNDDPGQRVRSVPYVSDYEFQIDNNVEDLHFATAIKNGAKKVKMTGDI